MSEQKWRIAYTVHVRGNFQERKHGSATIVEYRHSDPHLVSINHFGSWVDLLNWNSICSESVTGAWHVPNSKNWHVTRHNVTRHSVTRHSVTQHTTDVTPYDTRHSVTRHHVTRHHVTRHDTEYVVASSSRNWWKSQLSVYNTAVSSQKCIVTKMTWFQSPDVILGAHSCILIKSFTKKHFLDNELTKATRHVTEARTHVMLQSTAVNSTSAHTTTCDQRNGTFLWPLPPTDGCADRRRRLDSEEKQKIASRTLTQSPNIFWRNGVTSEPPASSCFLQIRYALAHWEMTKLANDTCWHPRHEPIISSATRQLNSAKSAMQQNQPFLFFWPMLMLLWSNDRVTSSDKIRHCKVNRDLMATLLSVTVLWTSTGSRTFKSLATNFATFKRLSRNIYDVNCSWRNHTVVRVFSYCLRRVMLMAERFVWHKPVMWSSLANSDCHNGHIEYLI